MHCTAQSLPGWFSEEAHRGAALGGRAGGPKALQPLLGSCTGGGTCLISGPPGRAGRCLSRQCAIRRARKEAAPLGSVPLCGPQRGLSRLQDGLHLALPQCVALFLKGGPLLRCDVACVAQLQDSVIQYLKCVDKLLSGKTQILTPQPYASRVLQAAGVECRQALRSRCVLPKRSIDGESCRWQMEFGECMRARCSDSPGLPDCQRSRCAGCGSCVGKPPRSRPASPAGAFPVPAGSLPLRCVAAAPRPTQTPHLQTC